MLPTPPGGVGARYCAMHGARQSRSRVCGDRGADRDRPASGRCRPRRVRAGGRGRRRRARRPRGAVLPAARRLRARGRRGRVLRRASSTSSSCARPTRWCSCSRASPSATRPSYPADAIARLREINAEMERDAADARRRGDARLPLPRGARRPLRQRAAARDAAPAEAPAAALRARVHGRRRNVGDSVSQHAEIIDALERGDSEAAAIAVEANFRDAMPRMLERLVLALTRPRALGFTAARTGHAARPSLPRTLVRRRSRRGAGCRTRNKPEPCAVETRNPLRGSRAPAPASRRARAFAANGRQRAVNGLQAEGTGT